MEILLSGAGVLVLYGFTLAIYRLYLGPLAKIPGPKIAALSSWYNAYYDLVAGGQYVWKIREMHEKYGPVVRTRPDAVHISDPLFIDKIYSQSPKQRRERAHTILNMLQSPGSILATKDHDLHRRRRAVINPYFSQQNVRRLEPVINTTLANLFRRMDGWAKDGHPVHMNKVFRAATKDVIQAYALGDGQRCLDEEDCNAAFFDVMTPQRIIHLGTHVYWLAKLLASLPPEIMSRLIPRVAVFMRFMEDLTEEIKTIRKAKDHPESKTIFHEIMRSDNLPASEKETHRLADEAMVLIIAGSETTAFTLVAIIYLMLADRKALNRLKAELATVMDGCKDSIPSAAELDSLPYLNSVIQEAIRVYPGATHRQDRIAPDEDLVYKNPHTGEEIVIPAGTVIGMSAPIVNRDKNIYGERADEFWPDRYLENPKLRQHQFAFSKGTRQCIGMNLAYQELQTFVAGIFHKYDLYDSTRKKQSGPTLELFQTGLKDIEMDGDYITPSVVPGSEGLRIIVRN
ncbi:Cytochrome P450 monooxygenase astB [Acrodontium crateriforme]|uniref:Cytochrome P450 monooxygenase astB n=1 Tax=Acrodontium crateriforme TaxID=150365 RepID=A0AAQ3R843_9PEZI|nr:Cytochrome P450 monooxygenase astB [Acrodontium crateriforme]